MKRILGCTVLAAVLLSACEQAMEPSGRNTGPEAGIGGPSFSMDGHVETCPKEWGIPSLSVSASLSSAGLVEGSLIPASLQGGDGSVAYGINDAETVAGFITVSGRKQAALKRKGESTWTQIVSADSSWALAINNSEQIVGVRFSGGAGRPFLYSGGTVHLLSLPSGYTQGAGFAINDHGQIAGFVRNPSAPQAFLWTPSTANAATGSMALLGLGGGTYTAAYGINNQGHVVGEIGGRGMFQWSPASPNATTGTFHNRGMPSGFNSAIARDINDQGEVVGYGAENGKAIAFYWRDGIGFVRIGTYTGGTESLAFAINNAGRVTGSSNSGTAGHEAFVWSYANPTLQPLGKLAGACSSRSYAINDCGAMVGMSIWGGSNATQATQWGVCEVPAPAIALVKLTNGTDNNSPTGPLVPVGSTVTWTYVVTNTGNVPLAHVTVTDDQQGVTPVYVSGDVNNNDLLDLTETWTYTATGIAVAGQYANIGTATGSHNGTTVSATDPDHYFGVAPHLVVTKTAGEAQVTVGNAISFTIQVRNTGTAQATNVTLTDVLPTGKGIVGWSIQSQAGVTCNISGNPQTLSCGPVNLEVGQSFSVTVRSNTEADAQCEEYRNIAYAEATNHGRVSGTATIELTGCVRACTPGFWQGGDGSQWWNIANDPDWKGFYAQPYAHATAFFGTTRPYTSPFARNRIPTTDISSSMTMFQIISTGGTANNAQKAGRSAIAAYLNAASKQEGTAGAYPLTRSQIVTKWNSASNISNAADRNAALLALHNELDALTNFFDCR